MTRGIHWVLVAGITLSLLIGCASRITVADIKKDSGRYQNRVVAVRGEVTKVVGIPFLGKSFFQLDDGTGTLWVMSSKQVPAEGQEVWARGEIHAGFKVGGETYGVVLVEEKE
jgi:hypothetical protein